MRRPGVLVSLLMATALAASACGSDREGGEDLSASSTTTQGTDRSTFGSLDSPCGEGDATGATDQGVTKDTIRIGYGDDAGFPNMPGTNHEMSDAVAAFVAWCNDQGGINGRRVEATYYDAKITEVNNVMIEACRAEFFLVGQGFALDSAQETTRRSCELPTVPGFSASPTFKNAPLHVEPLPVPADFVATPHGHHLAALFPDRIGRAGALFGNYSSTIDNKERIVAAFTPLGFDFVCEVQYNIQGEADWRPLLQRLKDCGAEIVYWVGGPVPSFQNALAAADQLDYEPVWFGDPNMYDTNFAAWNRDGFADKTYFRLAVVPLFEADHNEATQQYLDIVEADGGDVSALGVQSASAFLLWATAAKQCGDDLTRDCVLRELGEVHEWDGGGLHAPADPGANLPPQCGITLRLEGTSYVRVEPEEPGTFDCDPAFAHRLTGGPALERAKLDENRISRL